MLCKTFGQMLLKRMVKLLLIFHIPDYDEAAFTCGFYKIDADIFFIDRYFGYGVPWNSIIPTAKPVFYIKHAFLDDIFGITQTIKEHKHG